MEEIIKAIKSSTTNPTTNNNTPKILPHLNPKLTAYSTFVLKSDDLWEALYEEEEKIEEFFKMRRNTK